MTFVNAQSHQKSGLWIVGNAQEHTKGTKTRQNPALAILLYVDWVPQVNDPPPALPLASYILHCGSQKCHQSQMIQTVSQASSFIPAQHLRPLAPLFFYPIDIFQHFTVIQLYFYFRKILIILHAVAAQRVICSVDIHHNMSKNTLCYKSNNSN